MDVEQRARPHIPRALRERVKARFDGRCGYCGEKPKTLVIDHIVPVQGGGSSNESNLMPACASCNNYKMTHRLEFFRSELADQVVRLRRYSVNFRLAERFGLVSETGAKIVFYFERFQ
jgi:5-methylcytosine-specific restriction endonuclease McrA